MLSPFFGFFNRIGRVQFWLVMFVSILVIVVPAAITATKATLEASQAALLAEQAGVAVQPHAELTGMFAQFGIAMVIVFAVCFWMFLSSHLQRLHDLNHSGWWVLAVIAAPMGVQAVAGAMAGNILALAILLYLGFYPGTEGPNRFGDRRVGVMADASASTPPQGSYAAMKNAGEDGFARIPRGATRAT